MLNKEIINSIKTGDIVVVNSFYNERPSKEVVIIKEMWMNMETMEIRLKGLTVRENKEVTFLGQDVISLLKELNEVVEVDLSINNIESCEIEKLFYSWMKDIQEDHQVEYIRDKLIELLETAATRRLDEIE